MKLIYQSLMFILLILMIGSALADETNLNVSDGNNTSDNTSIDASSDNTTANVDVPSINVDVPSTSEPANLKYKWYFTIDEDRVTMVLDQKGSDLFGRAAKYEGEPWNAVVVGSVEGNDLWLVMTALKGKSLVAIKMVGTYEKDTLSGTYTKYDETGQETSYGKFTATWIDTDISSFTPAKVDDTTTTTATQTNTNDNSASVTSSNTDTSSTTDTSTTTKYVDVTKYKDQIGPAGLIPPGMGGSGLS